MPCSKNFGDVYMSIIIRKFESKDSGELRRLKTLFEQELQWSPPEIFIEEFLKVVAGISKKDPELVKLAVVDGEVVGYCIAAKDLHSYEGFVLDITMDSAYIWDMYVLKDSRNEGTGKRLLDNMIQYLKNVGKKNVFLIVNVWNEDGKKFYEANDFKTWGYFLRRQI